MNLSLSPALRGRARVRGSPSAREQWPGWEISTPTPSSLPGGVFGGSLPSLRLASLVAAQGRAQPGRALLLALLPPSSLLLLLSSSASHPPASSPSPLSLGHLPRLSLSLTESPRPSLLRPEANSGLGPEDKLANAGLSLGRGRDQGTAGEGAGQGVFLTRGGGSSSCRAGRPHPMRRPRRALPGAVGAQRRAPPRAAPTPGPLLRAATTAVLSALLSAPPRFPPAAKSGPGRTPAGRSANGSPTPPGPPHPWFPGRADSPPPLPLRPGQQGSGHPPLPLRPGQQGSGHPGAGNRSSRPRLGG